MSLIQSKKNQALGTEAGWNWEYNINVGDTFEKGNKRTWSTTSGASNWHRRQQWVVVDLIDGRYKNHRSYKTLEEALADDSGVPYLYLNLPNGIKSIYKPDWATLYKEEGSDED